MTLSPDSDRAMIRGRSRACASAAAGAACLALTLLVAGCASAPVETKTVQLGFPSPLSGPGAPPLERDARDHLIAGYQALTRGDTVVARSRAAEAGPGPASRLLLLQAELADDAERSASGLQDLTESHPTYAAAWLTLSVAAERSGDELLALESSATGAELWPDAPWTDRTAELRNRYVDQRVATATELVKSEDYDGALAELEPARAAAPDDRRAVLLETRILIALGELDRAETVLSSLPRDPEVVLMAGSLAEARGDLNAAMRIYGSLPEDPNAVLRAIAIAEGLGDWQKAMNLYASLPDDLPEKTTGLRRAQLRWRISVMPAYVQEAFESEELDRAGLAAVLVTLAPKVETLPGGQVPLLSDVMRQPAQREILTAVRHGLVDSDRLEHRYHPNRPASAAVVRQSITTLASLLSLEQPTWCNGDGDGSCLELTEPVAGETVASIVIDMVARQDS